MAEIRQATIQDVAAIQNIAELTWPSTYGAILTPGQLRYMLDKIYNADNISGQITNGSQTYLILTEGGKTLAFASYSPRSEDPEIYKLHKLYCLPDTQGKGYGKQLITYIEDIVVANNKHALELNVNRFNKALNFYTKLGYEISYEEDIDIGNGYFMNDYVMRKALRPL